MPHPSHMHADDLKLFPFKKEFREYSWRYAYRDLMAALSVALLTVPQSMAYALLAGLPLSTGLFAAIYSSFIATVFGSSRHIIIGPSNAIAILLHAGTAEILFTYYRGLEGLDREMAALQILVQLTLVVSIIQTLAAAAKLGRLTQFVSHSVIVGYISGTAIAVLINQLYPFMGIPNMPGDHSIYEKFFYFFTHLNQLHIPTAIIGLSSLFIIISLRRINKKIPAALIMICIASAVIYSVNHYLFPAIESAELIENHWEKVLLVKDSGQLTDLWPHFAIPYFDMGLLNHLLPVAFAIALLSILETVSVAKTIASNSGQHVAVNQEIFSIGIGNFLSSLISAMPISASSSRSLLNYSLGAKTRMSAIFNVLIVALILYLFSPLIMNIPMAALSSLLLITAVNIMQPRQFFFCIKSTNSDAMVLWITFLSCIFLSLDVAFYIGIILSITLYLKKSATPELVEYDIDEAGELSKRNPLKLHEKKTIRIIKVEGELFFGAADIFQNTLKTIAEDDTSTKVIVLQLKNARDFDATVCLALQQLHDFLKKSGRELVACGILQHVWEVLSNSGMVEIIGKQNLFIFDERHPHMHMTKALKRAKVLAMELKPIAQAEETSQKESLVLSEVPIKP